MAWGIGWGLLVIFVLAVLVSYVIIQETRAQQHWRQLVRQGDVGAIRAIIEKEVAAWREERPPRGVAASLWQGVQNVELVDVQADYVRVSAAAEAQYALVGAERREVSSPLVEAMKLTVKLADRFLYDIPNVELDAVQIDVYTTFRQEHGTAVQRCILSTLVRREDAADVDWDAGSPEEIVRRFGGRYELDEHGAPQPIEPIGAPARAGDPLHGQETTS